MSRRWPSGSSPAWRRVRAAVLARDGGRCRLREPGCTAVATQVHHLGDRAATGDDPAHLVAACRSCNRRVGDPTKGDPRPRPTPWAAEALRSPQGRPRRHAQPQIPGRPDRTAEAK